MGNDRVLGSILSRGQEEWTAHSPPRMRPARSSWGTSHGAVVTRSSGILVRLQRRTVLSRKA